MGASSALPGAGGQPALWLWPFGRTLRMESKGPSRNGGPIALMPAPSSLVNRPTGRDPGDPVPCQGAGHQ